MRVFINSSPDNWSFCFLFRILVNSCLIGFLIELIFSCSSVHRFMFFCRWEYLIKMNISQRILSIIFMQRLFILYIRGNSGFLNIYDFFKANNFNLSKCVTKSSVLERQHSIMDWVLALKSDWSEQNCICPLAVWPWVSYLTSLSLNCLTWKMKIKILPLQCQSGD